MSDTPAGIRQFQEWYEKRHDYARHWKARTGGKIAASFCSYTPEEILIAAGALPVRVFGSHEPQDVTEPYIFGMFCPFCRDALAQGLKGRYEYAEGAVIAQACLHLRQTYNVWKSKLPVEFAYYIPMPNAVQNRGAREFTRSEYAKFLRAVEEWTGVELTDQRLDEGIELMNENRRLLRQVYKLRQDPNPHMYGYEAMWMVAACEFVDKRDANRVLRQLLEDLPYREVKDGGEVGTRMMIIGSEDDDVEFAKMVESENTTIVVDDHCSGTRYFWKEVVPGADRLQAIADRYCYRPPCPTKDYPKRNRFPYIRKLAKDWGVEAAIVIQQKFCDPHEGDIPALRKYLDDAGIPNVFLEFDVTLPMGQFKTRVEAFLETIQMEDLF
jgi:benzoyl-CoA reductase subunit C